MKPPNEGIIADSIGIIRNWLKPLAGLFVLITIFAGYLLLGREALPSPVGEETAEGDGTTFISASRMTPDRPACMAARIRLWQRRSMKRAIPSMSL